ncbi:MAG: hypothetical protein WD845_02890 [Pirellulales bacterium]
MLRLSCIPLALVAWAAATTASAQQPVAPSGAAPARNPESYVATTGAVTPTPEMWFYEQEMNRYDNPKAMVHERAEWRANQRRGRLAAQKWYGISNSRPMVSPFPWFGGYGPFWGSNTYDPLRWQPTGTTVVARPAERY